MSFITLYLRNVHIYEPRSNFWSGEILKKISGESLYLTSHDETPWGFNLHCDENDKPHSVQFANNTLWSFCGLTRRFLETEWPLFLKDYPNSNVRVRVERIYTDSMYLSFVSENACIQDALIWRSPPRGGQHGACINSVPYDGHGSSQV
jgi:hypothetical protein